MKNSLLHFWPCGFRTTRFFYALRRRSGARLMAEIQNVSNSTHRGAKACRMRRIRKSGLAVKYTQFKGTGPMNTAGSRRTEKYHHKAGCIRQRMFRSILGHSFPGDKPELRRICQSTPMPVRPAFSVTMGCRGSTGRPGTIR